MKLTPREKEILCDVLDGLSDNEIAKRRYIEVSTVKTHLRRIMLKYDAHTRAKLIANIYKAKIDKITRNRR